MGIRRGRHGLDHSDFARYGQMLLNGGTLDGKTYLSPATFAAMTTDHIGPGSGVARNHFYYPGDNRLRLWFRHPYRSRQCGAATARLARRDQMGRRDRRIPGGRPRPGHVFVLMENEPPDACTFRSG